MIQDIAPHTYHNEYKSSAPDKNSFILAYEKGSILLPHQEREADIYFPRFQDLEEKVSDLYSKYIYLFSIDDQRFYLIPELDTTLLPDYEFQDIRNLRTARPQHLAFAGVQDISFSSGTASAGSAAAVENQCCTAKKNV